MFQFYIKEKSCHKHSHHEYVLLSPLEYVTNPELVFAYLKAPRVNDVVTFDFYTMKPSRKEDFTKVYAHVYFAFWLFLL